MSLFIHPENQKILWSVVTNNENFKRVFLKSSQHDKEKWFRNIIEYFYNKNANNIVTKDQLNFLNRDVIVFITNQLKQIQQPSNAVPPPSQPMQEPMTSFSRNMNYDDKKEMNPNQQFNERQKDYETMFSKPPPPDINFSENVKDDVITNMDELIKMHERQREQELQMFSPGVNVQNSNTIVIDNETKDVVLKPDDIDTSKHKKAVSWSNNTENNEEIHLLKTQISELTLIIQNLRNDFDKYVATVDNRSIS
jgi:hypothetical protein